MILKLLVCLYMILVFLASFCMCCCRVLSCFLLISVFMCIFFIVGLLMVVFCNCWFRANCIFFIRFFGMMMCCMAVYFCLYLIVIFCCIFLMNRLKVGELGIVFLFRMVVFRLLVFILKVMVFLMILGRVFSLCLVEVEFVNVIVFCLFRVFRMLWLFLYISWMVFFGKILELMILCIMVFVRKDVILEGLIMVGMLASRLIESFFSIF